MKVWRDNHKDYFKKWRESNKDKIKEYKKRRQKLRRENYRKNKQHYDEYDEMWRQNNQDKVRKYVERSRSHRASRHLQRKFGITIEEYNTLLESQNQRCAICQRHKSEFKRALHVDHSHDNKRIRGLLCVNCNQMLGHSMERIENLQRGIEYLRDSEKIHS